MLVSSYIELAENTDSAFYLFVIFSYITRIDINYFRKYFQHNGTILVKMAASCLTIMLKLISYHYVEAISLVIFRH